MTTDGGATWRAQTLSFFMIPLEAITFCDAGHGWAVSCVGDIIARHVAGVADTCGLVAYAAATSGRRGITIALRCRITADRSSTVTAIKIVVKSEAKTVKVIACAPGRTGV